MLRVGQREVDAIGKVLLSGRIFRYGKLGGQCERFERRYARYLGVKHVWMTASGTAAVTAALGGLGIGPGDEVAVPACTYMATAIGVLAAGAIPIIVDIDESITMDPSALARAIGPRTKAVVPVHMWGLPCDMGRIMRVAGKAGLLVVEDACQAIGGSYEGRKLGSIGHAGAFSFNYYKNMTCGEGGAVVTNDDLAAQRAGCMIDCCRFYWDGRPESFAPFTANGARASELEGAMMNVQLDRLDGLIGAMRRQKRRVLAETADSGLAPIRANSPQHECGSDVMYTLPTAERADLFAGLTGGTVTGRTGRHVYTEWDPIFAHRGAHHRALDPFHLPANRGCRMRYTKDMCAPSLDILNRTVMLRMSPNRKRAETSALIRKIRQAAKTASA